jgi:hypothetical protein
MDGAGRLAASLFVPSGFSHCTRQVDVRRAGCDEEPPEARTAQRRRRAARLEAGDIDRRRTDIGARHVAEVTHK